ncbi:MAG: sigma-70 family RNA polymerase sigma factor [Halioglobus sp.]
MTAQGITDYSEDERRWAQLMVSSQAGDEADYRCLLKEISVVIDRYLRGRFGHHDFIDDCVQDALIAVHQARHTYDSKRSFRPWLFAIVRHKAIDALRQQRRRKTLLEAKTWEQSISDDSAEVASQEQEISSGRLINSLAKPYREAITLTKLIGLSTAEAAAELRISEGALKVRVHRGIGRLRKMMEAEQV